MPDPVKPTGAAASSQQPAAQNTPQPTTEKQAPATVESNKAEASKATNMFFDRFMAASKANKEADKKEEKAEEKQEEKKEEQKPAPKSEEKKEEKTEEKADPPAKPKSARRRVVEEEKSSEVDAEKIAQAASRGVVEALKKSEAKEAKASAKEYGPEDLPEDFASAYDELKELSSLPKYKDRNVVAEIAEHHKAIEDYKAKWLRKNKGSEFDPDAEEHSDFLAEHSINIPQADLLKASRLVGERTAKESAVKAVDEKYGKDLDELRANKRARAMQPIAMATEEQVSRAVIAAVDPELAARYDKDPQEAAKAFQEHPYFGDVVKSVAPWVDSVTAAAIRISGGIEKFNDNDPSHAELRRVLLYADKSLATQDDPPKLADGREFVALSDFDRIPKSRQNDYYTVTDAEATPVVVAFVAAERAKTVANFWKEKYERWSKPGDKASKPTQETQKKDEKPEKRHESAPAVLTSEIKKAGDAPADPKAKVTNMLFDQYFKRGQ